MAAGLTVFGFGSLDCLASHSFEVCTDPLSFLACPFAAWAVEEVGVECARDTGSGGRGHAGRGRGGRSSGHNGSGAGVGCVNNAGHGGVE